MNIMKKTLASIVVTLALAWPAVAWAADKEQRQMMADLRILQEQSQQLQNLIAALTENIKTVNQRLDQQLAQQAEASRKAFADQKLTIDGISGDLRVLREKVDDSNVRVGSIGQELDALRQLVASLNVPRPFGAETDPAAGATGDSPVPPPAGAGGIGASPAKLLAGAMADYYSGDYELAILGLASYIKDFPQSPQADYAQYHIGRSYIQQGKYENAIEAYTTLIKNYPRSSSVPDAYVDVGRGYKSLKQPDKAKEAFEFVIKNFPDTTAATIAKQNLSTPTP